MVLGVRHIADNDYQLGFHLFVLSLVRGVSESAKIAKSEAIFIDDVF